MNYKKLSKYQYILIFGMSLIMIGGTLNIFVVTHNSCKMPIAFDYYYQDDRYISIHNTSVNYAWLGDILVYWNTLYMSIGDLFMFVGGITMFSALYPILRERRK